MRVLAAGSLRGVWAQLITHFSEPVETHFGPAGILQERILAGEECDLFASANLAHPQALLAAGRAQAVVPFASNKLCLTVRSDVMHVGDDWRVLLNRTDLRLATSTAGCDPSGDYTQELFNRMGVEGHAARQRALALVGGRNSALIPTGTLAAQWVIESGQAEMFIGYASYANTLRQTDGLTVLAIPEPFNPHAQYALAVLTPKAQRLAEFIQSKEAKVILREAGFGV
ncbi:molybdate ABC transporter substrate-binding protein [Lelliottia amnigena]|jgi:molybdate transport system substrate-binding protein|uniref:molybdate ABC transporter substrate-binding protein n=1 Tax=Lelliottia amnigena TaxID=61646 RepID=UPI0030166DB1